jgi:hypothetical protein
MSTNRVPPCMAEETTFVLALVRDCFRNYDGAAQKLVSEHCFAD